MVNWRCFKGASFSQSEYSALSENCFFQGVFSWGWKLLLKALVDSCCNKTVTNPHYSLVFQRSVLNEGEVFPLIDSLVKLFLCDNKKEKKKKNPECLSELYMHFVIQIILI